MAKNGDRRVIDKMLIMFGVVATAALLAVGGLSWWASSFIGNQIKTELGAQQIYFPPKGSAALNPQEFPGLQKYAGQQVDNATKAKAYADEFIAVHLKKIGGGKTYSQISAEAMKDPTNQKLQQQKATLFQGETLRGMLLGNGYAFGMMGDIAGIAAAISFVSAGFMFILVLLGFRHLRSIS